MSDTVVTERPIQENVNFMLAELLIAGAVKLWQPASAYDDRAAILVVPHEDLFSEGTVGVHEIQLAHIKELYHFHRTGSNGALMWCLFRSASRIPSRATKVILEASGWKTNSLDEHEYDPDVFNVSVFRS